MHCYGVHERSEPAASRPETSFPIPSKNPMSELAAYGEGKTVLLLDELEKPPHA